MLRFKVVGAVLVVGLSVFMSGCVSMSNEAMGVHLHHQMSNFLEDCKRLGNVQVKTVKIDRNLAEQQALVDLRQAAYDQYGADAVLAVNVESFEGGYRDKAFANGVAYSCSTN